MNTVQPMQKKNTFAISLLGLTESERRVVKSLCLLSSHRQRSYEVIAQTAQDRADILIADGQDREAMNALAAIRSTRTVPAVIVDATLEAADCDSQVRRPIAASRLLGVLDLLVTQKLNFFPELVIGGGGASTYAAGGGQLVDNAEPRPKRHTALVVDDSVTIRRQIELALRLHDIEAVCAETGEEALALLERHQFDIIFLDVVLPGQIDGYEICRSIKKNARHKPTPVIMLTGKSSPFDRVRGSLAGCNTYLAKPVENHTFNTVLKKYLKTLHVTLPV